MIKQDLLQSNFLRESDDEKVRMLHLYNFDIEFLKSRIKHEFGKVRMTIKEILPKEQQASYEDYA